MVSFSCKFKGVACKHFFEPTFPEREMRSNAVTGRRNSSIGIINNIEWFVEIVKLLLLLIPQSHFFHLMPSTLPPNVFITGHQVETDYNIC